VQSPAIFHVMSPFELDVELDRLWPKWARGSGVCLVTTLYDLIPLVFPEHYLVPDPYISALYMARLDLLRTSDQLLTDSECTARDAIERLGIPESRVTAIGAAAPGELPSLIGSDGDTTSLLRAEIPQIEPGFLLYVGGHDPRKNLGGAVQAYALLPETLRRRHQLVIAGQVDPEREAELRRSASQAGIEPGRVLLIGRVSDRQLAALYRACELFLFPSLYEGAGLPVLEAMACGAPVAVSASSSLPELIGDDIATFDPADHAAIAACVRRVLEDPRMRSQLVERSQERARIFTWERVARSTLEGYQRALGLAHAHTLRR
jgi:glycosyltransferase involved in cell wall biosynthesis